jgi:hypothetical protein
MASEIWSATLSGCPSETDSEVNRYSFSVCSMIEALLWVRGGVKDGVRPEDDKKAAI